MVKNDQDTISILIIDDDKDITANLTQYLTKAGYSVASTHSGREGLDHLKQHRPHIALVDLKLPDISGIELLKAIKSTNPDTIIILISGYATIEAASESIQHGAFDFIAKPFNFKELDLTLTQAMAVQTRKKNLGRLKKRNIIIALTLPLWAILGYLLIGLFL